MIPWVISDAAFVKQPSHRLDPKKTVFVGALHGMITSEVLFKIMDDLFGHVVFAGIDTDKYKYPIGISAPDSPYPLIVKERRFPRRFTRNYETSRYAILCN